MDTLWRNLVPDPVQAIEYSTIFDVSHDIHCLIFIIVSIFRAHFSAIIQECLQSMGVREMRIREAAVFALTDLLGGGRSFEQIGMLWA